MAGNGSRAGSGRGAGTAPLKRSGQVLAIKRPQPEKPSKLDQAFQSVASLKKAERYGFGSSTGSFLPAKEMTRARASKLGLIDQRSGFRRSWAESPRWRVTEATHPDGRPGYTIAPRSGVKPMRPAVRAGVIKRQRP